MFTKPIYETPRIIDFIQFYDETGLCAASIDEFSGLPADFDPDSD
jgi:hypothetical protein